MRRRLLALVAALAMVVASCGGEGAEQEGATSQDASPATANETQPTSSETTPSTSGSGSASGEGVTMGILAPFSGEMGTFGEIVAKGYETAAQVINDTGLLEGGPIEFITAGDTTRTQAGRQEAERMITNGAAAIMGPTSDMLSPFVPLPQSEQVGVTSPDGGSTAFNALGGDFAFRAVGRDNNDGL